MSFIRTVLGDISPEQMGPCYAHEHLIIDASYTTAMTPDFLLDDVDRCAVELKACYDAGVRTMVDSMPMACGRNVAKLVEVSQRSGINVVCPTGLHLKKYYPPGHWYTRIDVTKLGQLFVRDIEQGIDENDGNGPDRIESSAKAGLIKIATGGEKLDDHEKKLFEAAGAAHRKTGAPALTHTEQGVGALEQVEALKSHGVDLRHVVLSHLDRKPDVSYHREVLSTGVRIEYDSMFRWKENNPTLDLLVKLLPEFPDQIVLGMDAARRSYWTAYGGKPGMTFLYTTWAERMTKAGLGADLIRRVFITTPAETYSFCGAKE